MLSQDAEAFETVIQDLCLAFNRPYTTQLSRVFWETLKHLRIDEVKRAADIARKSLKKFPTPKDLIPERRLAPVRVAEPEEAMSRWAIAANKILFALAYLDKRRGFRPIAEYVAMPAGGYGGSHFGQAERVSDMRLRRALEVKADYVRMAEDADRVGEPIDDDEYVGMCREGFEKLLGTPESEAV